jgi:hypothetical protein
MFGYGLVAFPAEYGKTGKNSYVISAAGTVYQFDWGPSTSTTAATMDDFPSHLLPNTWVITDGNDGMIRTPPKERP